jgi:hypothetical protein
VARPFTDILKDIRNGRIVDKATDQMSALVREVIRTQRAGDLTLKLTVKPHDQDDGTVVIVPKLSIKLPQGDLPEGLFFTDADGALLRNDPRNRPLFGLAAGGPAQSPDVDPDTGEILNERTA